MSSRSPRLLGLAALLGLAPCGLVHAQVGPSSQNVKKPAPKKAPARAPRRSAPPAPVVRVRTVTRPRPRPKPVVARVRPPAPKPAAPKPPVAAIRVKPPIRVPGPDAAEIARRAAHRQAELARMAAEKEAALVAERLQAARAWHDEEWTALERSSMLSRQVTAPDLTDVKLPEVPNRPEEVGKTEYRQKVTLLFLREDGQPFDAAQVRRTPGPLAASTSGNRLELEGPRVAGSDAELQLALPGDFNFVRAEDARLSLRDFPGQETRVELPSAAPPRAPRPAPRPAPLFSNPAAEQAARDAIRTVEHQGTAEGPYPRPAAATALVLARLIEARRVLDLARPAGGTAGEEQRLETWRNAERARRLLDDAGLLLIEAGDALQTLMPAPARALLKDGYRIEYSPLAETINLAAARLTQYRAEAAWLQAESLDPASPDRSAAIQVLERAPAGAAPLLAGHLARYRDAAGRERRYREFLAAGNHNAKPPPDLRITHHLTRTVTVHRPFVDLRFAASDLTPEDRVTLAGEAVELTLRGGFWEGRLPRARLTGSDRLRFARKTYLSELQGELPLPRLDPYAANGNLLRAPEMRPVGIRTVSVTAGAAGEIALFRELTPGQLRELRREAIETEAKGGTWLIHRTVPLALRVERPAEEGGKKPRGDRLVVAGARLEGPAAGQVGGIRVGSSHRAVENVFATNVERSGKLMLMDGALEIVLRDGLVSMIVVHRSFALPGEAGAGG